MSALFKIPGRIVAAWRRRWPLRRLLPGLVAAGLLAITGGALILISGIVPINASAGHRPTTIWLFETARSRSVHTHSRGTDPPATDDPGALRKSAVHYEFECMSCHGRPGLPHPRTAQRMAPTPPNLGSLVPRRDDRELFYVVRHGLKFTGMPAWPALHRDDEVGAMVAFLRILPGLDEEAYQRMITGDPPNAAASALTPEAQQTLAQNCSRCHGHDGSGQGTIPRLAGQRSDYLRDSLLAYAEGQRTSGIMEPVAAGLDEALIDELAAYYSRLPAPEPSEPPDPGDRELIERGRRLAHGEVPETRIPACAECHEPTGHRTKDAYPLLRGQPAEYLHLQLQLFQDRHRGGTQHAHLMHHVSDRLDTDQIRPLVRYLRSAPPDR